MQSSLNFNGVDIVTGVHEGKPYVSVRHVCDALEIPFQGQHEKLKRSPEYQHQDILTLDGQGRQFPMFCILAVQAHAWVFGISASKITNPERQKQFIAYKHECARVLHNHFMQQGHDQFGVTQSVVNQLSSISKRLDEIACIKETVFGDNRQEITELVNQVARDHGVDGRTVWGWVQTECDVSSYKRQNLKIINFLRTKLGKGIKLVKED